ncbi:XRE family transcriptional regulator [Streptomyces sp. NPDC047061]|uniref:XRE family transcriptional regulator n=1 Tax=Streptomyces sp. NPDC047061 TaxID=3154605 RepID=UPI0033F32333
MSAHLSTGGTPGRRPRVAWLLRVNRLLGTDPAFRSLPAFAAAFRGGCYDRDVSVSTLSRWETARTAAPWAAVRRYEELLGLPRNLLTATARTVWRYLAPAPVLDTAPVAAGEDLLEDLLEQALSGAVMAGEDWDRLADGLCARPDVVLMPSGTWYGLAERLVEEMVIADDLPWMLRFETLNRLLNHPRGGRTVVLACAELAAGRSRATATEIVCALDNCGHPDATGRVLAELIAPSGPLAHRGAVMACFRKVGYRHFDRGQLRTLVRALRDSSGAGPVADQVDPLRRWLARTHPEHARDLLGGRGTAAPPPPADTAAGLLTPAVRRVTAPVRAIEPDLVPDTTVAHALVAEALTSPVFDVRLYAAFLLAATPYREPLADAVAAELARPSSVRHEELAVPLLEALRILGDRRHRALLKTLAVRPGVPRRTAYVAVRALGHVAADDADSGFLRGAVAHHHTAWRRTRDPVSAATVESLVYALGMAARDDLLAEIRSDPGFLPTARTAAAGWLAIPGHRRASALR